MIKIPLDTTVPFGALESRWCLSKTRQDQSYKKNQMLSIFQEKSLATNKFTQ